jgi:hypothetical protein
MPQQTAAAVLCDQLTGMKQASSAPAAAAAAAAASVPTT